MLENILLIWTLLADPRLFLIIAALAAFRLAELVVIDEGPFDVFTELRSWTNPSGDEDSRVKITINKTLNCVHCSGLYFAIFIVIGYLLAPKIAALIIFPIAIAGLQSILANKFGRQV